MEMGVNPEVNAPTAAEGMTSAKKSCLRIPGGIPVGGWGLLCLKKEQVNCIFHIPK